MEIVHPFLLFYVSQAMPLIKVCILDLHPPFSDIVLQGFVHCALETICQFNEFSHFLALHLSMKVVICVVGLDVLSYSVTLVIG